MKKDRNEVLQLGHFLWQTTKQNKKQPEKCGNPVAEKNVEKIVGGPLWDGEEKQKVAGSMYVCMVTHIARVKINRVRLAVLHEVS